MYTSLIACTLFSQAKKRAPHVGTRPRVELPSLNCGFDEMRIGYKKDSFHMLAEDNMNKAILQHLQQRTDTVDITLPVVFHVVGDVSPFLDSQLVNALVVLNDAFAKTGKYSSSIGADTHIRFCLAQTDPDGGVTTGITHTTNIFGEHLNPLIEDDKLKDLIIWPTSHYINIWVVSSIEMEIYPNFQCNNWVRSRSLGYATMPPADSTLDGIVISSFDLVLIEQIGHYLGLYHTFEGFNCKNNDCTQDGDKVCDTPPDATIYNSASCNSPTNSCKTDTLSGYTVDMPDQIANFMDNGNNACRNEFTAGQAKRMTATINTQRAGLLVNKCNPPCNLSITASFSLSKNYPLTGDLVVFTNTSVNAVSYVWLVDGVAASSTTNFSQTFTVAGKYKITLKAFNGTCFSTSTQNIFVTCGVTARFYTDKRQIASKVPGFIDSIRFTNNSVNATSYKWLMSNDVGMAEQVIGTSKDLTYIFPTPANYMIRLIAANGSCKDTTEFFTVPVTDPDPDGTVVPFKAECYQETKIRVSFYVCNRGYKIIPPNIPITFYDINPLLPTAKKIGTTINTTDTILGKCCSALYTSIVDVGYKKLNSIYIVFNDNGTTNPPLLLPNTSFGELFYTNNITSLKGFAFQMSATPPVSVLAGGDTVQLHAAAAPDVVASSYQWTTSANLSCTQCQSPFFIAGTTTTKYVSAASSLGCTDTASVLIQVPPYNDYSIKINDLQCAGTDSLHVDFTLSNSFKRPKLPKTLSVSFYSGDPTTVNAVLLPPVFSLRTTISGAQAAFSTSIKAPVSGGNVYAVVNDSGRALPVVFPNTLLLEKSYANNIADTSYFTDSVKIKPADTTVFRKQSVPLNITTTIYNAASTLWSTGRNYTLSCTTCTNPVAKVTGDATIPLQTANRYGCIIHGAAYIHVFPTDMQIQLKGAKCLTNNNMEVSFSICMNNSYDSVFAGIPVSFYDANPDSSGQVHLLGPVFYTPDQEAGNCHTYTTTVQTTTTQKIFGVVNDNGINNSTVPNHVFDETNFNNNIDDTTYIPFSVSVIPSDTSIERLGNIQLNPTAQGGVITSYVWSPAQFLSCTTCATPISSPRFTTQYILTAKNETSCTDTAHVIIRTHTADGVYLPDAFTPNGDGLNDMFYVLGGKDVTNVKSFAIYNRWGQKVFEQTNVMPNTPLFGWNGKVNGKEVETGTYVYSVTVDLASGVEKLYKGTVVLIK